MKPVYQNRTGDHGTCFSACLASIMELPLNRVADFGYDEDDEFLRHVTEFLLPFGLAYVQVSVKDPILKAMFRTGDFYHTVEGLSPRGGQHACVGLNGEIVFDPHPNANPGGLDIVETYGLLIDRNPVR